MEFNMLKVGQIVEGTVIKVEENTIYLEIGVRDPTDNFDKINFKSNVLL